MEREYKGEKVESGIHRLSSKDIIDSRKRVDKAVKIFKKSPIFTKANFDEALRQVNRRGKQTESEQAST